MCYNKFSDYLRDKYGCKVYKIPVNLPVSCPNRDGSLGGSGCIFCGEEGAGFDLLPDSIDIKGQIDKNIAYIGKNYNAKKFIMYFQNYSNTYLKINEFEKFIDEALELTKNYQIVALYISTRPDCINDSYLKILQKLVNAEQDVVIELGLQTVNYKTLKILKRGHTLAEFIDAVQMIKCYGFEICAHCILDIPFDDVDDVIETAKIISALKIEQVKCHSLYILEGTELGRMYQEGIISTLSLDDFIKRTILFLEYLSPQIIVQRLIGRAPSERTIFCNFGMSWWKIQDMIIRQMEHQETFQGNKFDYLRGKSLKFLNCE